MKLKRDIKNGIFGGVFAGIAKSVDLPPLLFEIVYGFLSVGALIVGILLWVLSGSFGSAIGLQLDVPATLYFTLIGVGILATFIYIMLWIRIPPPYREAASVSREIKRHIGLLIIKVASAVSIVFLLAFLIALFSKGSGVFYKYTLHNVTAENVEIADYIVEGGIRIDGKPHDVIVTKGTVSNAVIRKGFIKDICLVDVAVEGGKTVIATNEEGEKKEAVFRAVRGDDATLSHVEVQYAYLKSEKSRAFAKSTFADGAIKGMTITYNERNDLVNITGGVIEGPVTVKKNGAMKMVPANDGMACSGGISMFFITEVPQDSMTTGGIYPAITGTLLLTLFSILFAVPLGVLAAIFLVEYGKPEWLVSIIRTAINTLAGVPSIVFGLFGMAIFVNVLGFGESVLAGSLTLAVLILPIIINASEEAIKVVPRDFREAAYGVGATKRQMIIDVVLPAALPSILTGTIISVGRAAGETAPILFTAAAFYLKRLPANVFEALGQKCMALPYHIYALMAEGTEQAIQETTAYGAAIVLLLLVLVINLIAIIIRYNMRRNKKW